MLPVRQGMKGGSAINVTSRRFPRHYAESGNHRRFFRAKSAFGLCWSFVLVMTASPKHWWAASLLWRSVSLAAVAAVK
jgi:hypothetical protein